MSMISINDGDTIEGKYIYFQKGIEHNPKTWIYYVYSDDNDLLGQIKWYAQWRQYAFYPNEGTVFEKTCLDDIREFCTQMNVRQKAGIKPPNPQKTLEVLGK